MSDETPTQEAPASTEAPKSKRQMSFTDLDDGTIRADFGSDLPPLVFTPSAFPETIYAAAFAEGIKARLRGYTSKLSDENRTPEKMREAIAKGIENLMAGVWTVQREPGQGDVSIEAEAAHRYRKAKFEADNPGQTYTGELAADAAAFAGLSDEQKATLKKVPRYAAAYAAVKAERAAAKAAKEAEKAAKAEASEESVDF